MGRQTGLHLLQEDCKALLGWVQKRDPVVVVDRDANSREIKAISRPWEQAGLYSIWNQALLPTIDRKEYIRESNRGSYYYVDNALPVIELSYPSAVPESWNGRPALRQGRVWAGFEQENRDFERWFNSIVRWIRKNFVKNPVLHSGGYLGPAAHAWYKAGGILLPAFRPPVTPQWLSWVEAQDQHRALFEK